MCPVALTTGVAKRASHKSSEMSEVHGRLRPCLRPRISYDLSRHAGHADIVRELIDRSVGTSAERSNLPDHDADWWRAYAERLEETARQVVG